MTKHILRGWAGIVEEHIDTGWIASDGFQDKLYAIFKTRAEARKRYQRVVPCEITIDL